MSDDDIFNDLIKGVELSDETKRQLKKADEAKAATPKPTPAPVAPKTDSFYQRAVQWAEARAISQSRPWAR